ncbi:hypothetical protein VTJ04DRAFT_9762 [Mycothermus thermophilus]|uniref:uncharacterized protein n=1 Tax=Humicola insolens TaxID=85995 RepID=UPI0037443C97
MPPQSKLAEWFPHAQFPVIFSAPMLRASNGTLAAEVSKAGGVGVIPGGYNFLPSSPHLTALEHELTVARSILNPPPGDDSYLPVGVGFILTHPSFATHFLATALPLLRTHRPRAVWLFAPHPDFEPSSSSPAQEGSQSPLAKVIAALKSEGFVVISQVGTVAAAKRAVQAGADVIVAQGVDAGGHQFRGGAGAVTLVPEVGDMVAREVGKEGEVVVVAAGGVVDGRGIAAALALGAEGVVMGTRFIASTEASVPSWHKDLILSATDGGPSTVKTPVLDEIQGTGSVWPDVYDGRALVTKSWLDHLAGMPLEENIRLFKEAEEKGEVERKVTWAGTGVGLVKEVRPAGEIVREVREEAIKRIRALQGVIDG